MQLSKKNPNTLALNFAQNFACLTKKWFFVLCITYKLIDMDCRNGIPMLSFCDNSYVYTEYRLNFHIFGSTRPALNFVR